MRKATYSQLSDRDYHEPNIRSAWRSQFKVGAFALAARAIAIPTLGSRLLIAVLGHEMRERDLRELEAGNGSRNRAGLAWREVTATQPSARQLLITLIGK
jgi:hypothetical protein